jgi:2-dehydro-3-deoxygalactonokinase
MSEDLNCAIYVDTGTTNSRAWLVRGGEVLAQRRVQAGVRDTARDGAPAKLRAALRVLIFDLCNEVDLNTAAPSCVIAAGMITSSLGLAEVPHVAAPAGLAELAAATERHHFPEVTHLPFYLVPGVRSGPARCDAATVYEADIMRGEETLCVGLTLGGAVKPPATVLNLGSHWKAIQLDSAGRVAASVTSLAGEMIHTTQTQTILASAVPHERPAEIDREWCEAGMREQRRAGLARSLFCVRLLEQSRQGTPAERLAFLIGAFIAADLDALRARGALDQSVLIVGSDALAEAWRHALAQSSVEAVTLDAVESERALLAGLGGVLKRL